MKILSNLDSVEYDWLKRQLIRLKTIARKKPVLVLISPLRYQLTENYPLKKFPQLQLGKMLDFLNIPYLDLSNSLESEAELNFVGDSHWAPNGHRIAAAEVCKYIKSNIIREGLNEMK